MPENKDIVEQLAGIHETLKSIKNWVMVIEFLVCMVLFYQHCGK